MGHSETLQTCGNMHHKTYIQSRVSGSWSPVEELSPMTGINSNEASKLREMDREVGSRQVCDSCVGNNILCSAPAPPLYIRDCITYVAYGHA